MTTDDVSIRQIVNMTQPGNMGEYFLLLDTCGRLWRGSLHWQDDVPAVSYVRLNVPQVENGASHRVCPQCEIGVQLQNAETRYCSSPDCGWVQPVEVR
jgi:hypothetical protein